MAFPTMAALNTQLGQLFQSKQYAEALALATSERASFPDERPMIDYWRMCAAARVADLPLVYRIAEQALADGLWYGETMWRQTPSFQPLQGAAAFEQLVARSAAAEAAEADPGGPPLLSYLPEPSAPLAPLLLALHGNQSTATNTLPFWKAAVGQGWALALPQSAQAMYKGAYVWNDIPVAVAQVQESAQRLARQVAFDTGRFVLGGHSMGGLIAIHMALSGALAVRGFVVNGPAVPFYDQPGELEGLLSAARERGLRGYFIVGTSDDAIDTDEIHTLAEQMQAAGLACAVELVPDATHDYTPAYAAALLRGLAFVG
jgi:predicted esterase